jgi:hypothetical protein
MAMHVTHIYFAQQYLQHNKEISQTQHAPFIRGTLFPDIRYLTKGPRNQTHEFNVTLESISSCSSPFLAGKKFHCLLDEKREAFAEKYGVYKHLEQIPAQYHATFLKVLEDAILYPKHAIATVQEYLKTTDTEAETTGITAPVVLQWHMSLNDYLSKGPCKMLAAFTAQKKGVFNVPAEDIAQWNSLIPQYAQEPYFKKYVEKLIQHFDKMFKKFFNSTKKQAVYVQK